MAAKKNAALSAKHSSVNSDFLTPMWLVAMAKRALGGAITLDPASSPIANRDIKALCYFDSRGLDRSWPAGELGSDGEAWPSSVFLNPPGGVDVSLITKWKTKSRPVAWWRKLMVEVAGTNVHNAIFVGFSVEILQMVQQAESPRLWPTPFDHQICVPAKRIAFDNISAGGVRVPTHAPSHANVIVGVNIPRRLFREVFEPIGDCLG